MKTSYILASFMLFGFLGGCVSQNQLDALQARILRQEQQIQQMTSQVSGVQPAQADTWQNVQSLRQEISSIKGQLDDLNNATINQGGVSGMAMRVEQHHAALKTLEQQFALTLNLDEVAPASPFGAASSTTPTVLGAPPVAGSGATSTAPVASKDTATALYDAGIKAFNERKYQDALKSFVDFSETYTNHDLISNAWFWRGEANFAMGNYPAAALDYEQVIATYPNSNKAAASYLKQGISFIRTNKKDAAKFRLDELIKKFPNSPESTRAQQVLKDM